MNKRVLWFIVGSATVGVGFAAALTSSWGLRGAAALARTMLPGELSVSAIDGSLFGPISIAKLNYRNQDFSLALDHAQIEWNPWALLGNQVHIHSAELVNLRLVLPHKKSSALGFSFDWSALGFGIKLDRVRVKGGMIELEASAPFRIQSAGLSALLDADRLTIYNVNLESALLSFSANGDIARGRWPTQEDTVDAAIGWSARPDGFAELVGGGQLKGRWNALELTHNLKQPFALQTAVNLNDLATSPQWHAVSRSAAFIPSKLNASWPSYVLDAGIQASGDFSNAQFEANVRTVIESLGAAVVHLDGQVEDWSQLTLQTLRAELPEHNMFVAANGAAVFAKPGILFGLRGSWKNLRWPLAGGSADAKTQSSAGTFELSGTPQRYLTLIDGLIETPYLQRIAQAQPWRAQLELIGDMDRRWDFSRADFSLADSNTRFSGTGFLQRSNGELSWDVNGAWWDVELPLNQTTGYSHYGRYHFQGIPQSYQLGLDSSFSLNSDIAASASGFVHGDQSGFDTVDLKLEGLGGELIANGTLGWLPTLNWNIEAHADAINPGQIWSDWSGNLGGDLAIQGEMLESGLRLDVTDLQIDGVLRDYPLEVQAKGTWQNDKLQLSAGHVKSGTSVLDVDGVLGAVHDFNFKLDAPDLAPLWPHASGSLIAQGNIRGLARTPSLTGTANGSRVKYANYSATELAAHWDVDLSNQRESSVVVSGSETVVAGQKISGTDVRLAGTADTHSVSTNIRSDDLLLELGATGHWRDNRWQGEIAQATLTHPQFGAWRLREAFSMEVSEKLARMDQACFTSNGSDVCAQGTLDAERRFAGAAEARQLKAQLLTPMLPDRVGWSGDLSGEASWSIAPNTAPEVAASVTLGNGTIALEDNNLGIKPLTYSAASAQVTTNKSGSSVQWNADFSGQGNFNGTLSFPQFAALAKPGPSQPITGTVNLAWEDLSPLATLFPTLESPKGKIELATRVGGTMSKPVFEGSVNVRDGSVGLPDVGTRLSQISLQGQSQGPQTVKWNGTARSGEGHVVLTGTTTMDPSKQWPTQLRVTGESFELVRKPGMWLHASPALNVNVNLPDVNIDGDLTISKGTFESKGSSSALYPSSDITFTHVPVGTPAPTGQRLRVHYNVRTILGERVNFEAYGLTGRLEGTLVVRREPGRVTTGIGEVTIQEGRYRFYGSELDITRGRLIFASGPAANPDIDIRATRTIDTPLSTAVVGVQAHGRIKEPVFTLFSTPPMEDTNVLSYLLLGRPVLQNDTAEAEFLANAVSAITLTRGYEMAKRLAVTLGIEDTRLNNRGIFLGRAISPRLYMSYEIGLFEPANTLKLRYNLATHWQLKTETGRYNMVDFVYTVEH